MAFVEGDPTEQWRVEMPSLDGRRFRDVTTVHAGDVDGETIFEYHEADDAAVWASYSGGGVRLGFLVGTRAGPTLELRYVHVATGGITASGHCVSDIEQLDDGRLRIHETWTWESKPGSGTSVIEEIGSAAGSVDGDCE